MHIKLDWTQVIIPSKQSSALQNHENDEVKWNMTHDGDYETIKENNGLRTYSYMEDFNIIKQLNANWNMS